jgi:hypothetical protein
MRNLGEKGHESKRKSIRDVAGERGRWQVWWMLPKYVTWMYDVSWWYTLLCTINMLINSDIC